MKFDLEQIAEELENNEEFWKELADIARKEKEYSSLLLKLVWYNKRNLRGNA